MQEYSIIDGVTLSIALVGAVLGILNTWRAFDRDKVKLRVVPKQAIGVGDFADSELDFCIEVTNLSYFPVTVGEVGFLYRGTDRRGAIFQYLMADGEKLPKRMEPRTSLTVYTSSGGLNDLDGLPVKCVYANTDCGVRAKGKSRAFEQMAKNKNA